MSQTLTQEGSAPFRIASLSKPCATYYKIFGDLSSAPALIMIHGGPGVGHECFLPFGRLWQLYRIPVILYDQIGCGKSTHIPETVGDKSIWNVDLFVDEVNNLVEHLKLRNGYYILGHSFGGMIAPEFATRQPKGLKRLILASGIASKDLSYRCFDSLRSKMPTAHQKAILEARRTGDYTTPAYKAVWAYLSRYYLCRTENPLPEFASGLKNMAEDGTAYKSMSGDSPWFEGGNMLGWTSIPKLHEINVPTLVFNSEFDSSSQDIAQRPFFDLIPRVRWYQFAEAGHMPWLESMTLQDKVLKLVGDFLVQPDVMEASN
ncbi:hypothetical protein ANO11243_011190 [Dothideomycetidae sp. 11243]|nr:hypothetical protein ANO11243_011190 [fungal sp. No.11243]